MNENVKTLSEFWMDMEFNDHRFIFQARGYTNVGAVEKVDRFMQVVASYANPRTGKTENITFIWPPFLESKMSAPLKKSDLENMIVGRKGSREHFIFFARAASGQSIAFLKNAGVYFEILSSADTFYPKHLYYLCPKYRLMTSNEVQELEKRVGSRDKFPKMIESVDAMARYMDFRAGDVLEITRSSPTGPSVYYRLVVKA